MIKRILFAALCAALAMGTAARADSDTPAVVAGIHECPGPTGETKEVKLTLLVTAAGTVREVKVVGSSGDEQADRQAAECVAKWTYKPATHNGQPVEKFVHFTMHLGVRPEDMSGNAKAFTLLERDISRRCRKLFPVDRSLLTPGSAISLVHVVRLPSGEVQTEVTQSAGAKADKQAAACVTYLVKSGDHADLPANFTRIFAVNWAR